MDELHHLECCPLESHVRPFHVKERDVSTIARQSQFFLQKFGQSSGCVRIHLGTDFANGIDVGSKRRIKGACERQSQFVLDFNNHQLKS